MSEQIDRRTFFKILATAGASAAFASVLQPPTLGEAAYINPPQGWNPMLGVSTKPSEVLAAQSKEKLAEIYTKLNRIRKWESSLKDVFVGGKDGLYGSFHMYIGEEAVATGVCANLNKDDVIAGTHRGHGHVIAKGGDLNKMSAEIFHRQTGYCKGFGGSMHITDMTMGMQGMNGIVGASWYPTAGAAYAFKVRGTKQVAVAFGGDGASNSSYYFSAVRNALNYNLPAIFIIENNFWQIAIPMASNIPGGQASTYTKGLPVPSMTVDGNDVAAVFAAAKEAVDRARAGGGPSVIECMTYRWMDHSGFAGAKVGTDGAFGLPYRTDQEVRSWMERDCIKRAREFFIDRKLFTAAELDALEKTAQKDVDDSIEFARKSAPAKPEDGTLNVYAKGAVPPTQFLNAKVMTAYKVPSYMPSFGNSDPAVA